MGVLRNGPGKTVMIRGDMDALPNLLALHVSADWRSGHVAIASGWAAANADTVHITFHGRSGHGSRPNEAVDPIVMAAHFVTAVQTVVSRRVAPQDPAVVTVGSIHGGTRPNGIPDTVELALTVRSYSEQVRRLLLERRTA